MRQRHETMRDLVFGTPFLAVAVLAIGFGVYELIWSTPSSWTLVLTVIASVVLCGQFQVGIGRIPGLTPMGVSVTMLALQPVQGSPLLGISVWAIGVLVSQMFLRRSLLFALYGSGLSVVGAVPFVAIQLGLGSLDVWVPLTFLIATSAYYLVVLTSEFVRQRGLWALDRGFGLSAISPTRLGLLVLGVAVTASIMYWLSVSVIPFLENESSARHTRFVVLLTAFVIYILSQRSRYEGIERRLSGVLDAVVELPRYTAGGLATALQSWTQSIVQANTVEIRDSPAGPNEIGAAVGLDAGITRHLVASRKVSDTPFAREDERVLNALAHMASETIRIQHDVDTLEVRANSDTLTGLPNYGAFQRALIEANENRLYHEGIAVLFMDLDNFKKLNDDHGHHEGDELLRAIARRLQGAAGGGDFVSRVGGDEFVVILAGLTSLVQAKESADRIVEAVSQPLILGGRDMPPVVSAGLAFSSHRELDPQTLVMDADRSMLQVKRSRRQGGPVEGSSVSIAAHRSSRTNDIVARAIHENRLTLAFQPIVNIGPGKIWAFEALVRYIDPELGPIAPASLVARAKGLGLMNDLTRQIITKALDAAEEFHRLEPGIGCMTVNLELGQISEAELGPFIRDAARAHPNVSLCIELNERSLRSVTDDLRREAEVMQDAGIIIALDDYGSDDSSVGALVRFPMDILKIDKSLIDDLDDVRQREVIKALQGFGDNLDYTMVVEGIENQTMVDVLAELGVRNAQGYFYGRPLSLALTMARIRRWGTQAVVN